MSSKTTGESPAYCHGCLTCKNTVILDKDDMAIQAFDADKLSSLFSVFCDSVDILVEDTFDFKREPFPFCKRCKLSLIKLYQLTDQLNEIQGKISLVRGQFRSQMAEPVDEHESDPPSHAKRPRSCDTTGSKIHELRNLIYHRLLSSSEGSRAKVSMDTRNMDAAKAQKGIDERPHCSKLMPDLWPAQQQRQLKMIRSLEQQQRSSERFVNPLEESYAKDTEDIDEPQSADDAESSSDIVFDTTPLYLVKGETELRVYDDDEPETSDFQPREEYDEVAENQSTDTSGSGQSNRRYPDELLQESAAVKSLDSSGKAWLQCPYCPKKFAHASKWKRHVPIHADTKTYVCKYCAKGFCEKYRIVRHLQNNHNCNPENIESSYVFNGLC